MRALLVALVALSPAAARADDQELARAHFVTGGSYYEQARYAEALHEFEEAYRLSKRVGFLYNIGVCHEQLGHTSAAITAFEGYLGSVSAPAERADLQARIDRLRASQAAATATAATSASGGGLQLTAAPPPKRPVYKRGWFVGVMVGAAAVVVAGVTVGVVLGTASHDPRTIGDVTLR
jgi:Tetratricopeptide repeat